MLEKLHAGVTLVVDRYAYSGVAFTAAKGISGLSMDWCKAPESGLPAPDALIYLQIPINEALQRAGFGEERYESVEMQKEVRAHWHHVLPVSSDLGDSIAKTDIRFLLQVQKCFEQLSTKAWNVLDASKTIEDLQEEVRQPTVPRRHLLMYLLPSDFLSAPGTEDCSIDNRRM